MKSDEDDLQEASYLYVNALDENLIQANIALSFSVISSGHHFNQKKKKKKCPYYRNIITFIYFRQDSAHCFQ